MKVFLIIVASVIGYFFIAFLFFASWIQKSIVELPQLLWHSRNKLIWALIWPIYLLVMLLGNILIRIEMFFMRRR